MSIISKIENNEKIAYGVAIFFIAATIFVLGMVFEVIIRKTWC